MSDHPTSHELFEAAAHNATNATDRHIATCVRCQVLISRLREGRLDQVDPSPATLSALCEASPTVRLSASRTVAREPAEGDVWRTYAPASLLVWVRRIVDDDTVEAIPLTLDSDIADDMSLVVGPEDTPWGCEAVLILDYRTHVHLGALAERVGALDAAADVQLMLGDDTELSVGRVGAPILDPNDQRVEYREKLRFELSNYAPSIWAESHPATPDYWEVPRDELSLRLDGIAFVEWSGFARVVAPGIELVPCLKCAYLDSVVLVCRLSDPAFLASTERVVDACRSMVAEDDDADAVAVFAADARQEAIVIRRADMRSALGLPSGVSVEPGPYLSELPLVDILFKHFDRYAFAISWSANDEMPDVRQRDLGVLASEQVRTSAETVAAKGRAAHQLAKQVGYGKAVDDLGSVEAFVLQAARGDIEAALRGLIEDEER
ncbi:MAG: hypothetical protein QOI06_2935 [Nocardioidaceae bacterium]|jgi:hypothetical protein|nr:hypothetical protein [Nocardioidaceae bacterium]